MTEIDCLIKQCEDSLQRGRPGAAAVALRAVNPQKLLREERLALARLCRRSGTFVTGIRLLNPLVLKELSGSEPARPEELAEYAALLMKIGSVREALEILKDVDDARAPEAHLFRGICHMSRWEYSEAVSSFRQYLHAAPDAHHGFLARSHLASALIYSGRLEEARFLVETDLGALAIGGNSELIGGLYELRARIALADGRESDCAADLDRASAAGADATAVSKWRAVLEARRQKSIAPLLAFRTEAERREDWESVREADAHMLDIEFSQERFRNLMCGTPSPGYRERLQARFPQADASSHFYGRPNASLTMDITTGTLSSGKEIACGKKVHQVLQSLLSDFYAPLRIGALFSHLFPGEHFHFLHSPNRVHQLLWRTRTWLQENAIPVSIVESDGRFRLRVDGDFAFQVDQRSETLDSIDARLEKLRRTLPPVFSAKEAQAVLKQSEPTVRRLIQQALIRGRIRKIRSGKNITYCIAG